MGVRTAVIAAPPVISNIPQRVCSVAMLTVRGLSLAFCCTVDCKADARTAVSVPTLKSPNWRHNWLMRNGNSISWSNQIGGKGCGPDINTTHAARLRRVMTYHAAFWLAVRMILRVLPSFSLALPNPVQLRQTNKKTVQSMTLGLSGHSVNRKFRYKV